MTPPFLRKINKYMKKLESSLHHLNQYKINRRQIFIQNLCTP